MEVTAYWEGGYTTRVPIRDFEIRIDEPERYGGRDTGPMPTEMLLGTLAACFAMAFHHAAKKDDVALPDLEVTARGEYGNLRFDRIAVEVRTSHPDREQLEAFLEKAIEYCYVTNTLAGSPELEYHVAGGEAHEVSPPPSAERG
ncbi:MAG TPA: OsmC family protein [Actinomycetota bacterium]